jgi:hypothetical protein
VFSGSYCLPRAPRPGRMLMMSDRWSIMDGARRTRLISRIPLPPGRRLQNRIQDLTYVLAMFQWEESMKDLSCWDLECGSSP